MTNSLGVTKKCLLNPGDLLYYYIDRRKFIYIIHQYITLKKLNTKYYKHFFLSTSMYHFPILCKIVNKKKTFRFYLKYFPFGMEKHFVFPSKYVHFPQFIIKNNKKKNQHNKYVIISKINKTNFYS